MSFEQLVYKLNTSDWRNIVFDIHEVLKKDLQTNTGFIRCIIEEFELDRKDAIDRKIARFIGAGIYDLDAKVNVCIREIQKINNLYYSSLQYGLIDTLLSSKVTDRYPNLCIVKDFLEDDSISSHGYDRLCAVLYQVCNQSLSQANKSNAGMAGEGMVRAIFNAAGLKKDLHYSEQYKSKKGSDTDFVLPCVDNFDESNLEILVAAQLSTNDRGRLASSELKQGGVRYLVTGNGLDASTKKLRHIGTQILQSFKSDNIRIACFEDEINLEKDRIQGMLNKNSGTKNEDYKERLDYICTHVISFESFAKKLERFKN
ncbi:type II restriction endonuclease [Porticoccaceae bacterium]|nr:type II restriction endonuclease [Porticoccaceae bacterium]|tara:strand:+ start:8762 stop:9706 length:945 start_codon:yes stop_codon:yes gene_type:complete